MPDPIRFNLATLGQLQAPANPGIGWVGPERPAESWADIAADPLSALFDVGRGAVTGDAPAGMNLQGLGALIAAAMPVAGGAKALRAATKAATISELADEAAQRSMSVLKDMHGEPLVVYRGRTPGATGPVRSSVAYFTPEESAAREYSIGLDEGAQPNVLAAHLHLSNPAKESDVLRVAKQYGLSLPDEAHPIAYLEGHPDLVKRLRDEGFDGVVGSDRRFDDRGPITSYGVFDAHQVKPLTERPAAPTGIKAYHGSPHDFDQFSMSKIGTGEGAQAYGHGLYFAENPGVAEEYKKNVIDVSKFDAINKRLSELAKTMDADSAGSYGKFKSQVGKDASAEYDRLLEERANIKGKMYEVQIHASPDHFLDWDKPLSEQPKLAEAISAKFDKGGTLGYQRDVSGYGEDFEPRSLMRWAPDDRTDMAKLQSLQKDADDAHKATQRSGYDAASRKAADDAIEAYMQYIDHAQQTSGKWSVDPSKTGSDLYKSVVSQFGGPNKGGAEVASQVLRDQFQVPGIRYLDAGSRSAGEGSRNYVIFDEKLVSILKKYGVALPVIEGLREKAKKGGGVVPSSDVHSLVQ